MDVERLAREAMSIIIALEKVLGQPTQLTIDHIDTLYLEGASRVLGDLRRRPLVVTPTNNIESYYIPDALLIGGEYSDMGHLQEKIDEKNALYQKITPENIAGRAYNLILRESCFNAEEFSLPSGWLFDSNLVERLGREQAEEILGKSDLIYLEHNLKMEMMGIYEGNTVNSPLLAPAYSSQKVADVLFKRYVDAFGINSQPILEEILSLVEEE